jgi:hypothetical protein
MLREFVESVLAEKRRADKEGVRRKMTVDRLKELMAQYPGE